MTCAAEMAADLTGDGSLEPAGAEYDFPQVTAEREVAMLQENLRWTIERLNKTEAENVALRKQLEEIEQ